MTDNPEIEPEPRLLRPFGEEDSRFIAALATDARVTRYVGSGATWSPEYIDQRIAGALAGLPGEDQAAVRWFIGLERGLPVGLVVSSRQGADVEIGYWVSPDAWGRGIATWMVGAALEPIQRFFGNRRLVARVLPGNPASARVLRIHGFHPAPGAAPDLHFARPAAPAN